MVEPLVSDNFEIWALREGYFYLDGGTMFGIVPKIIWEKKAPADRLNRICLATNFLLIRTPKGNILVETGLGENWPAKFREIYAIDLTPGLKRALKEVGIGPEDINFVINTHLHFDHCGHNTEKRGDDFLPTFPRALYLIQKGEWEAALNPNERDKSSYLEANFLPLMKAGQVELIEGDKEIMPGVKIVLTPGHTAFHQSVLISDGTKEIFFAGDLVPTSAHIGLSYIMSYDLFPTETLKTKKWWLNQAVEKNWIVAYVHDPSCFFSLVKKDKDKFVVVPFEGF
ncbi:MAG: MBL fold metallo-hydrolase [Candidatus Aminicenantes bacterium]|nr:MBL fold metallo-hydrolase [Candidatus Aminicenantes bacterium]